MNKNFYSSDEYLFEYKSLRIIILPCKNILLYNIKKVYLMIFYFPTVNINNKKWKKLTEFYLFDIFIQFYKYVRVFINLKVEYKVIHF